MAPARSQGNCRPGQERDCTLTGVRVRTASLGRYPGPAWRLSEPSALPDEATSWGSTVKLAHVSQQLSGTGIRIPNFKGEVVRLREVKRLF